MKLKHVCQTCGQKTDTVEEMQAHCQAAHQRDAVFVWQYEYGLLQTESQPDGSLHILADGEEKLYTEDYYG